MEFAFADITGSGDFVRFLAVICIIFYVDFFLTITVLNTALREPFSCPARGDQRLIL